LEANNLPGEATAARFLGSVVEYDVKLDSGDHVISRTPVLLDSESFGGKLRVVISFFPEDTMIYDYPKGGLVQELGVE
jgi:hypothetical protein